MYAGLTIGALAGFIMAYQNSAGMRKQQAYMLSTHAYPPSGLR